MSEDAGELPRRVAHAIRTPMGVVGGVLEQLRDSANPALDRSRLLELGERGLAQIARIADRLGLLAAIERGLEPRRVGTDLGQIVEAAISDIAKARRRKGVEVDFQRREGGPMLSCDPTLMRAAVAELVDNAVRFAKTRVRVEIDPTDASVSVSNDGPQVDLAGISGISGERPVPADRAGLGIGLWMAGRILSSQGGSIDHVVRDDGAEFRLRTQAAMTP
ncbi:MAG: HAMP domain-containing histidine kinase [Deltaproteobacteria bacterium]|nr:HAMP domain-containing histidine kinase [Nannocystaceae bacterium]